MSPLAEQIHRRLGHVDAELALLRASVQSIYRDVARLGRERDKLAEAVEILEREQLPEPGRDTLPSLTF